MTTTAELYSGDFPDGTITQVWGHDAAGKAAKMTPAALVAAALIGLAAYWGPALPNNAPLTQTVMRSAAIAPFDTYPALSNFEWQHNSPSGYVVHLTQGASMGAGAALIGLGGDESAVCLFVNNKKAGIGIKLTQNDTITDSGAYGMLVNASSTVAPAVWIGQGIAGAKAGLILTANVVPAASQKLAEFYRTVTTASDTLIGYIMADTGDLDWRAKILSNNAVEAPSILATGSGAALTLYNTAGTANKRRFRLSVSSNVMTLSGRNDSGGTNTGDLMTFVNTDQNIGFFGGLDFGGGLKVISIPNAGTAPTSNPTGAFVMYGASGAGKARTPSGNIVTFAPDTALAVSGSRGGNAALASLITQLASLGFVSDSTSA